MKNILFLLIHFLLSCSAGPSIEDIRQQEYGDLYFEMDCWWSNQENLAPTIFWCTESLETELISGYVSLAIEQDLNSETFFSICGRDVVLNTGHQLHDSTVRTLTENHYNCIDSYERELGNEFDWIWDEDQSMLQMIWRPAKELDKVLTLFVEPRAPSTRTMGRVYYKTGRFDQNI